MDELFQIIGFWVAMLISQIWFTQKEGPIVLIGFLWIGLAIILGVNIIY